MGNQSFYLYQLQKIDRRSDQIHARLVQIQALIGDRQEYNQALQIHQSTLTALQDLTTELASLEKKNTDKRVKMEISESTLYGGKVKNPKELTDLQQEIASLKANIRLLENEQIDLMLQIEEQQKKVSETQAHLDTVSDLNTSSNHQLVEEESSLTNELNRSKVERGAILQQLIQQSIDVYESLRKAKKGIAVAGVEDQCCTICGSQLTPAEVQQAKSPTQILRCPSCGRILYAD